MTVHIYKPVYLNVNTIVISCVIVSWIIAEDLDLYIEVAMSVFKLLKAYIIIITMVFF